MTRNDPKTPLHCLALLMPFTLVLAGGGCGAGKGDITGYAKQGDKPLAYGTVSVLCTDGLLLHGNIMPDGSYIIHDVPVGPVKVAVVSPDPELDYKSKVALQRRPEAAAAIQPPDPEVKKKWFPISETYQMPETSGLEFEVRRGTNNHNIVLDRPAEKKRPAKPTPGKPRDGEQNISPRTPVPVN